MKVLLIEPSRLLAGQYTAALEAAGHTVTWRQGGQAGVLAADSDAPDVVIIELLLKGHSGVEFLYEFRSYAEWQDVPVIVLTGIPRSELNIDDTALHDLGVTAYLYRPETTLQQLVRAVRRANATENDTDADEPAADSSSKVALL